MPTETADGGSHLQEFIPEELLRKLEAARDKGGMVGERRIVTMLFCDVKGSTAAAEQLDPEDWSEIMNGAFVQMIKPVYRYEGTVARLMGDALLAFFGAPIAHEDDPQRAILAGLDIASGIEPYRGQVRQRYGVDFSVRVGINTGLVVVGAVGSDLRMEYSALGDAVNVAARMEQTAQPGTVQVAHDTYRLVSTLFEFEELGGIDVKGKAEPVTTYRVLGRKADASRVRGIEGLQADMVGRQAELQSLQQALGDLKRGVGRVAFVVGEAGLGKTRLIAEARKPGGNLPKGAVSWIEAISLSYDANQAYGVVQRLIRRMGGPAYDDPVRVVKQKLEVLTDGLEPDDRERVLPRLRDVVWTGLRRRCEHGWRGLQARCPGRHAPLVAAPLLKAAHGSDLRRFALVRCGLHRAAARVDASGGRDPALLPVCHARGTNRSGLADQVRRRGRVRASQHGNQFEAALGSRQQ